MSMSDRLSWLRHPSVAASPSSEDSAAFLLLRSDDLDAADLHDSQGRTLAFGETAFIAQLRQSFRRE